MSRFGEVHGAGHGEPNVPELLAKGSIDVGAALAYAMVMLGGIVRA